MLMTALMLAAGSIAAPTNPCSCTADALPRLSVAETTRRLVYKSWPPPPPGARIQGNAVFEVIVSSDGKVCCVKAIRGHPLLLSGLVPALQRWRFRPGKSFIGVIVTRYSSEGYRVESLKATAQTGGDIETAPSSARGSRSME